MSDTKKLDEVIDFMERTYEFGLRELLAERDREMLRDYTEWLGGDTDGYPRWSCGDKEGHIDQFMKDREREQ